MAETEGCGNPSTVTSGEQPTASTAQMLCWYLLVLAARCVMDSGSSALSLEEVKRGRAMSYSRGGSVGSFQHCALL